MKSGAVGHVRGRKQGSERNAGEILLDDFQNQPPNPQVRYEYIWRVLRCRLAASVVQQASSARAGLGVGVGVIGGGRGRR